SEPEFTGPPVLVARDQEEAEDAADAFAAVSPLIPGRDAASAVFAEDERARMASLELLKQGARLVVATPEALAEPLPLPRDFGEKTVRFTVGSTISRDKVLERLHAA